MHLPLRTRHVLVVLLVLLVGTSLPSASPTTVAAAPRSDGDRAAQLDHSLVQLDQAHSELEQAQAEALGPARQHLAEAWSIFEHAFDAMVRQQRDLASQRAGEGNTSAARALNTTAGYLRDRVAELRQEYSTLRAQAGDGPAFRSAREAFRATLDRALSYDGQAPGPLTPPAPVPARPPLHTEPVAQRLLSLQSPEMTARMRRPDLSASSSVSATAETTVTPDLQKLAASLGNSPARIYEWVHNTINYEPYYGVRQTAQTTYENRAGNDADTSTLLVTLLRAAGYQAEYIVADVAIPGPLARNWLGHATTAAAAQAVLGDHPNVRITQDDRLIKPHVFVAVRVNRIYSVSIPMAMRSQAQSRNGGQPVPATTVRAALTGTEAWVYLDASVKELSIRPPISPQQFITDDAEAFWDTVRTGAQWEVSDPGTTKQRRMVHHMPRLFTVGNGDVDADDIDYLAQVADGINNKIEAYVAANPNVKAADLLGEWSIVTKSITALPTSFPFPLPANAAPAQSAALPDTLRTMVTISLLPDTKPETTETVLDYTADYATLSAGRVSISYEPATESDRRIVARNGGTYLVGLIGFQVVPVLRVDGTQVAVGPKSFFGAMQTKRVRIAAPNRPPVEFSNVLSAGDTSVVKLAPARANLVALERNKAALLALAGQRAPDKLGAPGEDLIGPALDIVASDYFGQVDAYNELLSRANNVRYWNNQSAGFANHALGFKRIFGATYGVEGATLQLDIKNLSYKTVSLRQNQQDVTRVRRIDSLGSALEHGVFEQAGLSAYSTMRVLAIAAERGIPIATVDKATRDAVPISRGLSRYFEAYLDQGFEVTTPVQPVKGGDATTGVFGFIARHPDGRSAYMIGNLGNHSPALHGGELWEKFKQPAAELTALGMLAAAITATTACELVTLGAGTIVCLGFGLIGIHATATEYFDVVEGKTSPEEFFENLARGYLFGKVIDRGADAGKRLFDNLPPQTKEALSALVDAVAESIDLDALAEAINLALPDRARFVQQYASKVDACAGAPSCNDSFGKLRGFVAESEANAKLAKAVLDNRRFDTWPVEAMDTVIDVAGLALAPNGCLLCRTLAEDFAGLDTTVDQSSRVLDGYIESEFIMHLINEQYTIHEASPPPSDVMAKQVQRAQDAHGRWHPILKPDKTPLLTELPVKTAISPDIVVTTPDGTTKVIELKAFAPGPIYGEWLASICEIILKLSVTIQSGLYPPGTIAEVHIDRSVSTADRQLIEKFMKDNGITNVKLVRSDFQSLLYDL